MRVQNRLNLNVLVIVYKCTGLYTWLRKNVLVIGVCYCLSKQYLQCVIVWEVFVIVSVIPSVFLK